MDLGTDGGEFRHVKREDNIKMNLSEIFYNVNWIDLAHNKVQCFAVPFCVVCVSSYDCQTYSFVSQLVNSLSQRSSLFKRFIFLTLSYIHTLIFFSHLLPRHTIPFLPLQISPVCTPLNFFMPFH